MFRDYGLLQARIEELHRDAQRVRGRPFAPADGLGDGRRTGRASAAAAVVARWFGRRAMDLADRLDPCVTDFDTLYPQARTAAR